MLSVKHLLIAIHYKVHPAMRRVTLILQIWTDVIYYTPVLTVLQY